MIYSAKMLLDETLCASQLNVNDKDDKNYPVNQQKSPLSSYDPDGYCTTREAAKILGTSLRTIHLWVESGILQAWKTPGGHRRVMRESMQRLFGWIPHDSALRDEDHYRSMKIIVP